MSVTTYMDQIPVSRNRRGSFRRHALRELVALGQPGDAWLCRDGHTRKA